MQKSPAPFPASKRLNEGGVKAVLLKGRRSQGQHFELRQTPKTHDGEASGARLAISVPKRLLRLAVERNRIKRLVRDAFRLDRIASQPLDLLVVYRSKVSPRSASMRDTLRADLGSLFAKVASRNAANQPNVVSR